MKAMQWLHAHDRDYAALRRAARAALVMPAMFALADKVIGNPVIATFAAFGSFAMLLLVDFAGSIRDRLEAEATLAVACCVLIALGTLASRNAWLAGASMAVVGFAVLFSGVVSSVLAGATTPLLLSYILPVTLKGPASSIPDRIAGWGLASVAALFAISLLWPAPARNPIRGTAINACRALAKRLRTEVAYVLGGQTEPLDAEREGRDRRCRQVRPSARDQLLRHPISPDRVEHRDARGRAPGRRAAVAERGRSALSSAADRDAVGIKRLRGKEGRGDRARVRRRPARGAVRTPDRRSTRRWRSCARRCKSSSA